MELLKFPKINILVFGFLMHLLSGCGNGKSGNVHSLENERAPATIHYSVTATYPHDTTAFTEGFLIHDGNLFESTGSPSDFPLTRSLVGIVDLNSGAINKKIEIDRDKYFGEGIVFLNNKLYQLTYVSKVGFIYNAKTFKPVGEFPIRAKEGWGLTTDGSHLIMSDGTDQITYLDTITHAPVKTIHVHDNVGPVKEINELEYINGFIYANVFTTNYIVRIDPETGMVTGRLDLTSLAYDAKSKYSKALEMNGIAYDPDKGNIYVTGKFWPHIYAIRFNLK